MTPEQAAITVTAVITVLGWLDTRFSNRERFAKLEVKVDTMWDFQMRRAESETIIKGIGQRNSPIRITNPSVFEWFKGLEEELQKFYLEKGKFLTDRELSLEIERRFGARISAEICVPQQLTEGACLIVAMALAKQAEPLKKTGTED